MEMMQVSTSDHPILKGDQTINPFTRLP